MILTIPAKTELSTIGYQPLLLMGGVRDWDAALLLAQTWVWASVAVLPSTLRLRLWWE
jgi:hypothetical protein